MRTSDICPTCSTYTNALCVVYNGPLLTTLDIDTLDSVELALQQIEAWATALNVAIDPQDFYDIGVDTYSAINYTPIGGVTLGDHWLGLDTALSTINNDIDNLQSSMTALGLSNTSDGTSHTVTLDEAGGSMKLIEGENITLTTTGTASDGEVTITAMIEGSEAANDTVIDLTNSVGNNQTTSANANAGSYTIAANPIINGWDIRWINAASEPTVTGATQEGGIEFEPNVDMYLFTWNKGTNGIVYNFNYKDALVPARTKVAIPVYVTPKGVVITTGTNKNYIHMPYDLTLTEVRAGLDVADNALFTVDILEGGVSILSTKLTIDSGELTSNTAATPPVISDGLLADWAKITFDITTAGTTAEFLVVYLIGTII